MEYQLLGHPAAGKGGNLILDFFFRHQVMLAGFHLHGVTERARSTGDNGNLVNRGGMGLKCRHQGVSHLMIGDNQLLLIGEYLVLLLVACDDHLHTLLQITLGHKFPVLAYRAQSRLVDDIGQLRAGSACCRPGNGIEIHAFAHMNLFGVNLQDILAAL